MRRVVDKRFKEGKKVGREMRKRIEMGYDEEEEEKWKRKWTSKEEWGWVI